MMIVELVHISKIRPGDVVEVGGVHKTVSPGDIRQGFMGRTLWGDSYRLGTVPVRRVLIKRAMPGEAK